MAARVTNDGTPSSDLPKPSPLKKSSRTLNTSTLPQDIQQLLGENWMSASKAKGAYESQLASDAFKPTEIVKDSLPSVSQAKEAYNRQLQSDTAVKPKEIIEESLPSVSKAKEIFGSQLQSGNSIKRKEIEEHNWPSVSTLKKTNETQLKTAITDIPKGPQENFDLLVQDDTRK